MNSNNNTTPLVSICIPTYNGANFIKETLDTALNQTYTNIEIIITDDNSSDNTVDICKEYAKNDARIKVFENSKNLGLVGNWCESIGKASSKWVKFLFQDDLFENNCIEKMITTALEHKVDFVICNREYFFEKGFDPKIKAKYSTKIPKTELIFESQKVYTPEETAKTLAPNIFFNCIGEPPTFLFNKEKYSRSDFPDGYFQLIDYIFILNKILEYNFVFISEKLVKFRIHSSSESMKNNTKDKNNKTIFYKYLHIQYYERIQICYEVIRNPIFKNVKKLISDEEINLIKKWFILRSYRRHGYENVLPFYQESKLKNFILDGKKLKYNYLTYKLFSFKFKKTKKTFNI